MARMTIYVGDDLRKRVDRVKTPVNWSLVARDAFEIKLGEIAAQKGKKVMQDVIDRLSASKVECEDVSYKEGFEAGESWAKDSAKFSELKNLETVASWESAREYDRRDQANFRDRDPCVAVFFLRDIEPGKYDDDQSAYSTAQEWLGILGFGEDSESRCNDGSFWQGFEDGALSVWRDVKDKV